MNKVCKLPVAVASALVLMWQSASCEKYVLPGITATPDTLRFSAAAGTRYSDVSTGVKCSVSISRSEEGEEIRWISCDQMDFKGKGNARFNVTVEENTAGRSRNGAVIISSEAFDKKIIIIQEGAL